MKALTIGESIPAEIRSAKFRSVSNISGESIVKLDQYAGQVLIIDFWGTWCSSCIAAMPKLHQLEEYFQGKVAVLATTPESGEKVTPFMNKNSIIKNLNVNTIVGDTILSKLFPHKTVPHYVWIDETGIVRAFTSVEAIEIEGAKRIIEGRADDIIMKVDVDRSKPLFTAPTLPERLLAQYSILLKGNHPGLPSGVLYPEDEKSIGIVITNSSLRYLYELAAKKLYNISPKLVFIDTKISRAVESPMDKEKLPQWKEENYYSIELRVPKHLQDSLYHRFLEYLNSYSGYFGKSENRKVECLVLKSTKNAHRRLKSSGGETVNNHNSETKKLVIQNNTIAALVGRLYNTLPDYVVDETNIKYNIDLEISLNDIDLYEINKELKKYNLTLSRDFRELTIFSIR
ncbi:TlpA family protein disulfide reductase [Parapedobacter sp. ISTM3]|uniref:TlpA family protein disulfide reductase n=1 Tax=Parapedobacter sp. ISTM3 TaxID=2800130 RepID=UPI0019081AC5|nr:TlpA disulfide reductase family protein [Parapedobacter sp. ISTM3]MBK1440984.1 TlpA family protein disulfide reductase [Parapedobacter sp. ISTM3]